MDDALVAINKPPGLLVHRTNIDRHERRFAVQLVRDAIGRRVYPVHRLDKPTSGVLVFALSPETARAMAEQFVDRAVRKTYVAVVRGWPPEEGVVDRPLTDLKDRRPRNWQGVPQPARTWYRRLGTVEFPVSVSKYPTSRYALVEVRPETGKQHQVRRHLRHISHPIIGDSRHGEKRHNRFFERQFDISRMLLACTEASFRHPVTEEPVTIIATLGGSYSQLLEALGWTGVVPPQWLGD